MQQAEREQQTRLAGGEASIQPTVQALPWCEGLSQLPLHVIPSNPNGTPVKIKSSGLVQTNLAIRPATMGIQQSSQPGDLDAVFNEHRQWPVAPTVLPQPPGEYMVPLTQLQLGHSVASFPYAYTDPCFGGYVSAFMVHPYLIGMQQTCLPFPSDMSEEPVLVNRKQFHGIMRRRRLRAKAESQNKLIKTRKPYLHESRHLHAMRRARGSGGRFLNTRNKEMCKTDNSNKSSEEQSSQRSSSPDATTGYMALSGSKCSMDKTVPVAEREIKQGAGYSNVTSAGCLQSHNEYAIRLSGTVQGNFRKSYQNQALHSSAFRSLIGGSDDDHGGQLGILYQMGHSKELLNYSAAENIFI